MQKAVFFISALYAVSLQAQEKQLTYKHFRHTLETSAGPEKIWAIWTDVPNWNTWDTGLKKAEMTEKFTRNAKGVITSLENRKSKFSITDFEEGKTYTFRTKLPLGSLYVKRSWDMKNGKTYFTHEVWFTGLTGGIFARKFGPRFREMLPEVMNKVKKIAEQ
jgi:hypothetical protein